MNRPLQISRGDALWVAGAGAITGTLAALLTRLGNPIDGGVSIACFLRDIAGALGLHQYLEFSAVRAELVGILLGAAVIPLVKGEFKPSQGSAPAMRFVIGMLMAFGVFVFVGCPMRTGLRCAGGDPAALYGLAGLIAGVWIGTQFLKRGFTLGPSQPASHANGLLPHAALSLLLVVAVASPAMVDLTAQRRAPLLVSLGAGALIGIAGQQTKLCFIGGLRNFFLIGDLTLLCGFVACIVAAFLANLLFGQAHLGVHIIGSADMVWSFFALLEVGLGATLLGGCPFRQLILCGQGNTDSAAALLGLTVGAAIAYNLSFAFVGGSVDIAGKIAVAGGIALLAAIAFINKEKS